MKTLDKIIYNLKNGGSEMISESNDTKCFVEKSGKGDKLRFIRVTYNYNGKKNIEFIEVFKTVNLK